MTRLLQVVRVIQMAMASHGVELSVKDGDATLTAGPPAKTHGAVWTPNRPHTEENRGSMRVEDIEEEAAEILGLKPPGDNAEPFSIAELADMMGIRQEHHVSRTPAIQQRRVQ